MRSYTTLCYLFLTSTVFEESQMYVPTSDDVVLYTVNVFSVVVMFNDLDIIMYVLATVI